MLTLATPELESRVADRLAGFPRFLHANGFGVGAGDAVDALDVGERIGLLQPQLLRWSLRALLCTRCDEWRRFDALFDAWFLPPNRWAAPQAREVEAGRAAAAAAAAAAGSPHDKGDVLEQRQAASHEERLARTDFRQLAAREHQLDIEALMRRFARRIRHLQLRRETRARQGRRLDLRSTILRSVATGGTPLHLHWQDRRRVRPRLVLLLDVSRSMAGYGFFYLRLARALQAELADVHSFIFHTRVIPVTEPLRDPDPWRAQERLHLIAQGWGGGTRIGECLAEFERDHAPRLVHARTALLVMSDGYDTGEPAQLAAALARLRRRARRIVWFNPVSTRVGQGPGCAGMQAALPHLDLLAPGGNLAAIATALPAVLEALR